MNDLPTAEEARQWLTVQLDVLYELRMASARNPAFQQWRNNTLALAERIWPHQSTKYKRFRRIPFMPSSAKATDRATREVFEKGCSEARRLLQLWIAEINLHGLLHAGEGGAPDPMPDLGDAPASEAPGTGTSTPKRGGGLGRRRSSADAPGTGHVPRGRAFGLGRGNGDADRGPARSSPKRSKPRLKDMLGLGDDAVAPADEPARKEPPPKPAIPMLREPVRPKPVPLSPEGELAIERLERPNPVDRGPDVLERSISDAMQAALSRASETDTPARASKPPAPTPAAASEGDAPVAQADAGDVPPGKEDRAQPAPATSDETRKKADEAPAAAVEKAAASANASDSGSAPADVASSRSEAVSEIIRLASDLDLLGVPESEARALRNALLEVGRTLDSDAPAWSAIEEAVTRGVRHPALARKLLPLLAPFLDEAA